METSPNVKILPFNEASPNKKKLPETSRVAFALDLPKATLPFVLMTIFFLTGVALSSELPSISSSPEVPL